MFGKCVKTFGNSYNRYDEGLKLLLSGTSVLFPVTVGTCFINHVRQKVEFILGIRNS